MLSHTQARDMMVSDLQPWREPSTLLTPLGCNVPSQLDVALQQLCVLQEVCLYACVWFVCLCVCVCVCVSEGGDCVHTVCVGG